MGQFTDQTAPVTSRQGKKKPSKSYGRHEECDPEGRKYVDDQLGQSPTMSNRLAVFKWRQSERSLRATPVAHLRDRCYGPYRGARRFPVEHRSTPSSTSDGFFLEGNRGEHYVRYLT